MKTYKTNYRVAVEWLNTSLILCNNLPEVDSSVYDNMRFSCYNEETEEYTDVYQWYITDCMFYDMEFLEEKFGLKFTYSDMLECWILCVDHFGTAWDYVPCETTIEHAARELGERI